MFIERINLQSSSDCYIEMLLSRQLRYCVELSSAACQAWQLVSGVKESSSTLELSAPLGSALQPICRGRCVSRLSEECACCAKQDATGREAEDGALASEAGRPAADRELACSRRERGGDDIINRNKRICARLCPVNKCCRVGSHQ